MPKKSKSIGDPGTPSTTQSVTLPALPTVRLPGDAIDAFPVNYAVMSLIMGVGALDDGMATLVPFVDMEIAGPDIEDGEEDGEGPEVLFSEVVTLENAAFVMAALLRDYGAICGHLADLAEGKLRPEPARVTQARMYMLEAREQVQACIERLDTLVDPRA